jgi:hypothetical protein
VHRAGIGQITEMEKQPCIRLVGIAIEMVDPAGVEAAGSSYDAVNLVPLLKQQLGEV